jgi:hypothetical protein
VKLIEMSKNYLSINKSVNEIFYESLNELLKMGLVEEPQVTQFGSNSGVNKNLFDRHLSFD